MFFISIAIKCTTDGNFINSSIYFSQKQFYNTQLCVSYGGRDYFGTEGLLILDKGLMPRQDLY